jgi:hypothetical protein
MYPPERKKIEYEKVELDTWIPGIIEDIEYDMQRESMWEGKKKVGPAVRFKLKLDGYKYPKKTRWGSFNLGEKSNLYKKYVSVLVEGAKPDVVFDLDLLKGMAVKTMWSQNEEYQNLEMIRPLNGMLKVEFKKPTKFAEAPEEVGDREDEIPF